MTHLTMAQIDLLGDLPSILKAEQLDDYLKRSPHPQATLAASGLHKTLQDHQMSRRTSFPSYRRSFADRDYPQSFFPRSYHGHSTPRPRRSDLHSDFALPRYSRGLDNDELYDSDPPSLM